MEDERLRQIRELINNPGFPANSITRDRVSSAMRGDMLGDGQLDPALAAEMRRKLADQMFMEMRLRGATEFGPFRAPAKGRPEDIQYADADRAAAVALQNERSSVARALAERERQPAAPDYTDERMRQAMAIGLPAPKDDMNARIQEEADSLFLRGKMEGRPIEYKDADLVARDRMIREQRELRESPYGPVGGQKDLFSQPMVVNKDYPIAPDREVESLVVPGVTYRQPSTMERGVITPADGPELKAPASPRRFITAPRATPVDPPADATTRPETLGEMDAVSEAATRALAKRRAQKRK